MQEFENAAEQLFYEYKENRLPAPSLRQQFSESGYLDTIYDDFRSELIVIKSGIVSSSEEAQQCNLIIEKLVGKLKDSI